MSPEDVQALSYVEFISLIRETNRCPGGKDTVRRFIDLARIGPESHVLEIGSNTGFTSLELARTARCTTVGVDVNADAVRVARAVVAEDVQFVRERVHFEVASALELPFEANRFDAIVAGGATGFIEDRNAALDEYRRVLRPWGFLCTATLFYEHPPPPELLGRVSATIGVEIQPWTAQWWRDTYAANGRFEVYHTEQHSLDARPADAIRDYVAGFLRKPHLRDLPGRTREAIRSRWTETLETFNENHRYLGYLIAVLRKRHVEEEPELFVRAGRTGSPLSDRVG